MVSSGSASDVGRWPDDASGSVSRPSVNSEQMLRIVLDTVPGRVFWKDRESIYLGCNAAFAQDSGLDSPEQILGKSDFDLSWKDQAEAYRSDDRDVMESGISKVGYQEPQTRPDGTCLWLRTSKVPLRDDAGRVIGMLGTYEDITGQVKAAEEHRQLETRIQHAQKLESLGVLAGGIAHDFNNILAGILGNADLALTEISEASPARANVDEILRSGHRASDLCRQLLAYSGKGHFVVRPVSISDIVEEMGSMLEVTVSKKIALRYALEPKLPPVVADLTQLRQVVMNLITNASEAIGDESGIISVSSHVVDCDTEYLHAVLGASELEAGRYVTLDVTDTGCGMSSETVASIFDPFFTTKLSGRGLGLAAVLGIVRGHHGTIKVYSEEGKGTTFKLLLPAVDGVSESTAPEKPVREAWSAHGTVLVADDEESVLAVTRKVLERAGFRVLLARNGRQALELFEAYADEIACVVLDLTMPELSGEEAFLAMRHSHPSVPVVMTSGYDGQEVTQRLVGRGLASFVQKPYRAGELLDAIRDVIQPG